MSPKLLQRAAVLGLILAAVGGAVAAQLVASSQLNSRREAQVSDAEARISTALDRRAYYLEDVADMIGVHDDADITEFSRYAAVRGRHENAIVAVQWVRRSPSGRLAPGDVPAGVSRRQPLLVAPAAGADLGFADALSQPIASAAIRSASIDRRAAISAPLELSAGSPGFFMAVPVEARAQSGEVATLESRSAMVGLIDGRALLAEAFAGASNGNVRVDDGGAAVGEIGEIGSDPVVGAVPAFGQVWTVAVSRVGASAIERLLPWLILVLGLGLAAGVAAALRNANRRRDSALHELKLSLGRVELVNQDLELAHAEAERRSREDPVTGVFNRRHFTEMLTEEMKRPPTPGPAAGVLLLDLDHFKRVNDEHGHLTGDAVLRATAQRIAATMRSSDCLARWGGEEFAVLAPGIGAEDLSVLAERIRSSLADQEVEVGQLSIPLTLSVGGVLICEQLETPEAVVAAADLALYEAKDAGRNRVRFFNPAGSAQPV
jgi:diguanylate cyclase (GGDEF)-like protein